MSPALEGGGLTEATPLEPLVQIRGRRVAVASDPIVVEEAARTLRDRWFVRLPQLLDEDTLARIHVELEAGRFEPRVHPGLGVELCLVQDRLSDRLQFQLNDPAILRLIEAISGRPLGCFMGRIYRIAPGLGHFDEWHQDLRSTRQVSLTLNLSAGAYRGGDLRMRSIDAPETEVVIPNRTPGDAILFDLQPELEHRIGDIEGEAPKTALAGWFCTEPDFHQAFRSARAAR